MKEKRSLRRITRLLKAPDELTKAFVLDCAIKFHRNDVVKIILDLGMPRFIVGGKTFVHQAVAEGNRTALELLMQRGAAEWINATTGFGVTPLGMALSVKVSDPEMIAMLLEYGAKITTLSTVFLPSHLDLALQRNDERILQLLFSYQEKFDPPLTNLSRARGQ